jgi:hypothetical protein
MKNIIRSIPRYEVDNIFGPVRDKLDYVRLITKAANLLLLNFEIEHERTEGYLSMKKDKMSRMFFYRKDRVFSVSFPFHVDVEGEQVIGVFTQSGLELNSESIACLNSVLNNETYNLKTSIGWSLLDAPSEDLLGFSLLEEIVMFEPGYIRYDCDETNENGSLHPLNHLDINYSQYGSFKLGLYDPIDQVFFEDILDLKTACAYLEMKSSSGRNSTKSAKSK